MIVIGLTGSLATGKSTVSSLLRHKPYNLPIIDADILARQVIEPGTSGYRQVLEYFGPSTPNLLVSESSSACSSTEDGNCRRGRGRPIDRAVLGRRVFGSSPQQADDRKVLNDIIHPLVRREMIKQTIYYYLLGHWAVILDVPLLFEGGLDIFCSIVIMVAVSSASVQMDRLRLRDQGLSLQEAQDRVQSQMGVEEKISRTRFRGPKRGKLLMNDDSPTKLEANLQDIFAQIKHEAGGSIWNTWLWFSPVVVFLVGLREIFLARAARSRWETLIGSKERG